MKKEIVPFSLKDAPALIEHLLPVQKLSVDSYREQDARQSKTLTPLGSYWKGRKPLVLNKACVLGSLLPFTGNSKKDLQVFELLMGMDDVSIKRRLGLKPDEDISGQSYKALAETAKRQEEVGESLFEHIWSEVNGHLGTQANSFPQLVEQLGIMRFGRRPIVSDPFCGSGQIPFEAARLGCDVYASDLNPIACFLTWGSLNLIGGSKQQITELLNESKAALQKVSAIIDELGIESDGSGWSGKAYLYCAESVCPQSGWRVPLLPSLLVSKGHKVVARLEPRHESKTYRIVIVNNASESEIEGSSNGTVISEGRDSYLVHEVNEVTYKTKLSTLRGDFERPEGGISNKLRLWESCDFVPRHDDIFQERLYAVLWAKNSANGKGLDHEFREVTDSDIEREKTIAEYLNRHFDSWQELGYIPSTRIEAGNKTDEPIRTRGWTHWHHLFNPRQLLLCGLLNQFTKARSKFGFFQVLNNNSKLSRWNSRSGVGQTASVFDNQALNTLLNYGCRGLFFCTGFLEQQYKNFSLPSHIQKSVASHPAAELTAQADIFITDPPYGDAVKYEEILEYFIAWLKKSPPDEFASWTWDSRRSLAIKGEDEAFRSGMVGAFSKMSQLMPENGIQVMMFTHQSGSIWADMANIVWASGLCVTAAWYVVTETDSGIHDGSYVKGTVLLILRKRSGNLRTTRDDVAWEIKEEVEKQVADLTGLNQLVRSDCRNENVFEDADLQMAGYAAALRALTRYEIIDGRDMPAEAIRPRIRGEATFVDGLIEFAVGTANQALVPTGIEKSHWDKLGSADRFYLKMTDLEARGAKALDNYQNFAKAFKVKDFQQFMASKRANDARLKSAVEFGRQEMSEGSEFYQSPLRATLYAVMEIVNEIDGDAVVQHLSFNVKDYLTSAQPREMVVALADYLSSKLEGIRPEEASAARVLRDLVRNQRLG